MPSQLFSVVPDDRFIVLQLQVPNLDSEACEALQNLLSAQVEERDLPVIIDLARAKFLPSMAIGELVQIKRRLDEHGRAMFLTGLSPNIRRALELSKLQTVLPIADTLRQASASLQNQMPR
jgi:anti-anti-sigma factor